jgi:hypothetical protein
VIVKWLQDWYVQNCDGEWEHDYGVVLETLDNPGWLLKVDVKGTEFESRTEDPRRIERSEVDWIHWWVEDDRFHAAGGPGNLEEMLRTFRGWVGS